MKFYQSPRWSGEILDCSMPMTFDTYNKCSYDCLYCFSYFQRSKTAHKEYMTAKYDLTWVNVEKIKQIFLLKATSENDRQFHQYVKERRVFQWGGLSDQFDNYEKKNRITLELLRFFKEINYPICFSTKGTWWLDDPEYRELFLDQKNWNVKFSIITMNEIFAKKIERGVDSPEKRLEAIKKFTDLNAGGATLRLRPFIIGLSNYKNGHIELIKRASENGAQSITTEFMCLDARADGAQLDRFNKMSEIIGFDIYSFYKKYSTGVGYLRLNREIKRKYIEEMQNAAELYNINFYVSDAHFKERCTTGCCCGLGETWNWSRGQQTEALQIAKKNGKVHFSDISTHLEFYKDILWKKAAGFNTANIKKRAMNDKLSMYDFIRNTWNQPNSQNSPYKYFQGILKPIGVDENNDVIYEYDKEKE